MIKLIVGLGNPLRLYRDTRHNIGKAIVEEMAKLYRIKLKKDKELLSSWSMVKNKGVDFILAYPLVFMNLSGESVIALIKRFKVEKRNLLVICDDLDLKLGMIRIKPQGGDAGHRGLRSVIESIGSNDFCRLRIGIGRIQDKNKISNFVLSEFEEQEKCIIEEVKKRAIDCCQSWLFEGINCAMNRFN
ncbi:MAG: aminoacyl-tRNA hydrolase [Candidatus Omnitrophica bacterium]|nr:aminoacyl-tRNA hydrolase [Candidatus Omnitrophota bacterium]